MRKWICLGVLGGLLEMGIIYQVAFADADATHTASARRTADRSRSTAKREPERPAGGTPDGARPAGGATLPAPADSPAPDDPEVRVAALPVPDRLVDPAPAAAEDPEPAPSYAARRPVSVADRARRVVRGAPARTLPPPGTTARQTVSRLVRSTPLSAPPAEPAPDAEPSPAPVDAGPPPEESAAPPVDTAAEAPPVETPEPPPASPPAPAPARGSIPDMIRLVFGPEGAKAIQVAICESELRTEARNGQYHGLFQMGSNERARYGHGPDAMTQIRAAFALFLDRGWQPWTCA